ncbi:MAG: hypothetical protein LBI18_06255 [Planctomycetaceae bacterium]|jgi:hypothetical protein|nr:hypothetical protein [Planctomycetaceae bacterium]
MLFQRWVMSLQRWVMFRRNMVGDVSPKHHVGDSRPAPVFGRKSDFKPFGNIDFRPNTGTELPCGNATFRRKVAHHKGLVCDVSAKHHLPLGQLSANKVKLAANREGLVGEFPLTRFEQIVIVPVWHELETKMKMLLYLL